MARSVTDVITDAATAGEQRTMSTFAAALRALIDESRISQAELGRRLRVSPQSVSAWVTGNSTPSLEHVLGLEDVLAADRGSLLRLAGYTFDNGATQPSVESLIRADPGLDPEDKRLLLRLLLLARERHKTTRPD